MKTKRCQTKTNVLENMAVARGLEDADKLSDCGTLCKISPDQNRKFQLLAQKIKCLLSKQELSEEENSHIKNSISILVHNAQENSFSDSASDTDVNNYCYSCVYTVNSLKSAQLRSMRCADYRETDSITKQEYCGYFNDLVSIYAQLHQLPKFFVKFLLELTECIKNGVPGKFIIKGQLFPEIQKSLFTHFQDLPFGQTLELWKIFAETYTIFANMDETFSSGKGSLFLLAQLFSAFLLHSKLFDSSVPEKVFSKFGDLIHHTTAELEKNICVFNNNSEKDIYIQKSFLLLCFAIGEVKLAYNYFSDEPFIVLDMLQHPSHPLNLSLLHSFLDETHAERLNSLLKSDDKVLSILVFQLLAQKIKGLLSKKEISEEENSHIKNSISILVQHAVENCCADFAWDTDLCTLNENNYGCAVWRVFLKLLPIVLNVINHKDLLAVTNCAHDVLQKSPETPDETSLYRIILSSFESGCFSESKSFQTVYVASLWKFDISLLHKKRSCEEMESEEASLCDVLTKLSVFRSKWIKYAETKPKYNNDEGFNSLWNSLKDVCETLNQVLVSGTSSKFKIKAKIYNKIKLINCLPLEYLLPGNQMRSVVGLSILFFLLPDICDKTKVLKIAEEIAFYLMAIFDGVRSIWLFDFVTSGPYLQEVVNVITKLMEMTQTEEIWSWAKLLLSHITKKISGNSNTFLDLQSYLKKMEKEAKVRNNKVYVLSLVFILENIAQLSKRARITPEFKETYQKIFTLSSHCFLKFLKLYRKNSDEDMPTVLLSCYMTMIEIINSSACPVDQKIQSVCMESITSTVLHSKDKISDENLEHEIYLRFIMKMCSLSKELSSFLPEDCPIIAWDSILLHLQNRKTVLTNSSKSSFKCDNHVCKLCSSLSSNSNSMMPVTLEEYEMDALKSILLSMPENLLNRAFEKVSSSMLNLEISKLNVHYLQVDLIIVRYFIETLQDRHQLSNISQLLLNVLNHLYCIINELCQAEFFLFMVKIPVLQLIHLIVKSREPCIPKSSLTSCLHSCLAIKFEQFTQDLPKFIKSFNSVWIVIYDLLVYHPNITLSSKAAYLSFVTLLLKHLVRASSQDNFSRYGSDIQLQMQLCAQNMDRLLTIVARHKIEVSKLVPYIIADYVDSVQHITVESSIKVHLISGINRLLDVCSEESVKMLAVNINHRCRDIYSNIVKNHRQHRYQGAV